jgi:hypothetical protein
LEQPLGFSQYWISGIFCSFTLLVCGKKNILPNLTNSQELELGVFGSLEPEPLEKKVRSRSLLKICRLPSPELKYSYAYACKSIVKTCTLTSEKNPRDLLLRNCRLSSSSINILFNQCHSVQTHIEI